jgi:hypothetical protein
MNRGTRERKSSKECTKKQGREKAVKNEQRNKGERKQ